MATIPYRLSRRRFVAASAAALLIETGFGRGKEDIAIPLAADLDGVSIVRRLAMTKVAHVERLGSSGEGRPIDLISVGRGSRAALIVGAPHANEPLGCATIIRLLERLADDRALREDSGWRWHFIPAIDIDGIALNQGWFRGARTLERYVDNFYRPPFRLQPEYAFPLDVAGYRFDQQTAENRCWRQAIDRTRPQLQCSLHGADVGGSFFVASGGQLPLSNVLSELPAKFDIKLNTVGDPPSVTQAISQAVFAFPDLDSMIKKAVASGRAPDYAWNAGDSSAGYSTKRYGTFNLVCEVPLWRDVREGDSRASGRTLNEVIAEEIETLRADEKLLMPQLSALRPRSSGAALALFASVQDAVQGTSGAVAELEEMKSSSESNRGLSFGELVEYEAGTAIFRTLAMATRLARLMGNEECMPRQARLYEGAWKIIKSMRICSPCHYNPRLAYRWPQS